MLQWIQCLFGLHDTGQHNVIIREGAVFRGDVCRACLCPVIGEFICNEWDEAQTVTNPDGSQTLHGVNPILQSGEYFLLGDEATLHKIAQLVRGKR